MTQQGETNQDPLVGQTVAGKYKIVRQLGEGGMGCVYLAEQMLGSTARKVALKTLHKHLSHDAHVQARFDREAGTVAALEHPNTIQVFDYGKMDDGTLYIVMEFVQGRSVADILEKDGAMSPQRVENIMRQVCGSLEEAHSHGIIHRDLKPDNVVLCERAGQKDWVEVLDFGIAKRSSEHDPNEAKLTQQGMVLGTPPYMSPEQFTGQPIDVRSDIYALGVMAYEMLTANLPFAANTAWEWASKHMTEMPTPLERQPLGPNVPPAQRAAIMKALSKNKDDRFPSVSAFFAAFSGQPDAEVAPVKTEAVPAVPDMTAPSSGDAGGVGRAKTEMAQPAVGGPGFGGGTPDWGGGAPAQPANVPQGPAHHAPAKKGGNGLVIGLGALAVLLLGGGAVAALSSGKKSVEPVPMDLSATPSVTASAATTPEPSATTPPEETTKPLETAPPLKPATTPPAGGGGTKPTTPSTTKPTTPSTVPTPTPKGAEPAACAQARQAKADKKPAAIVNALEKNCRAGGGTP